MRPRTVHALCSLRVFLTVLLYLNFKLTVCMCTDHTWLAENQFVPCSLLTSSLLVACVTTLNRVTKKKLTENVHDDIGLRLPVHIGKVVNLAGVDSAV